MVQQRLCNGAIINWITLYLMEMFIGALAAVAAAMVLQVNRFQPHSVWLRQWQNILHYIVCYFAADTALQNGVGIQLITAQLLQPHHVNGPLKSVSKEMS